MTEYNSFKELAEAQGWSEAEQRQQLADSISDMHKYVYGVRSRWLNPNGYSIDALAKMLEQLSNEADELAMVQEQEAARCRAAYEAQVRRGMYSSVEEAENMQYGCPSPEAFGLALLDEKRDEYTSAPSGVSLGELLKGVA